MVSQVGTGNHGPRRPRNRRGEGSRLREELIEAALRLLRTADRESEVSIRAVTRAAGAAPQSFYLQFSSLDELLYAVYEIEYEGLRQAMADAASQAGEPRARLRAVCQAYCRYAQEQPGRYRALTSVHGQAHHDGWKDRPLPGAPAFAVILDTVAAALSAAGSKAEPFPAAATLWASLHGLVTLRASRPAFPWPAVDDMIASLVEQVLHAPALHAQPAQPAQPGATGPVAR
jgi:AcrR family transcriptional regulator